MARPGDIKTPEQWYVGSLFAPSPANSRAGTLAIEPFLTGSLTAGTFTSQGAVRHGSNAGDGIGQFTLLKYGVTDHLSLYSLPTFSYSTAASHGSSFQAADLPVEIHYRLLDATPHKGIPSVTAYLGFSAPIGRYRNLARAQDGSGQGTWFLRYGLQAQSTYTLFHHQIRLRGWAVARQALASAHLQGISTYGTGTGFEGVAHPGAFGNEGFALEYGLNKRWVLALDAYATWSASSRIKGTNHSTHKRISTRSNWSGTYNLGPAIEYNWSPTQGAVLGAIVPVAGHAAARSISPELAVDMVF